MFRLGIIGLGNIAQKAYLPVIAGRSDVEVHLYTRNEVKRKELLAKYRFAAEHDSVKSLIDSGVEAVFVHSATVSHPEIVRELMEAGVPTYVDKPLADNYQQARELTELANKKGVALVTGFNRRFAPFYQALKETADVNMITMQKNRANQPAEARNFIFDDFIHVVDTVLFHLAEPIERFHAIPQWEAEKLASITVQFQSKNKVATASMNRNSGVAEEELTVISKTGKQTIQNLDVKKHKVGIEQTTSRFPDWDTTLYKRGFESIITAFIEQVKTGEEPIIPMKEALATHEWCEKILESIQS